jgi:hypothetical protein
MSDPNFPVLKPLRKELTISKLLDPGQIFGRDGHMPSWHNVCLKLDWINVVEHV